MDRKLCPGIHLPPLWNFHPLSQGKPPTPLIQKFFKAPFLKFWLESQTSPSGAGGAGWWEGGCPICSDHTIDLQLDKGLYCIKVTNFGTLKSW